MPSGTVTSLILFFVTTVRGQITKTRQFFSGELQMNFPGIYFKHQSTDYALMPYSSDSCFRYIAANIKDIARFVIWRDSSESEQLTVKRIKKLKSDLNRHIPSRRINIQSMKNAQKISHYTIERHLPEEQVQYLLPLNSVFEVYTTRIPPPTNLKQQNHIQRPRIWCWGCWKTGFHFITRQKLHKAARQKRKQ